MQKTTTNSLARAITVKKSVPKLDWQDLPRGNCETCGLVFATFVDGYKQCNSCLKPIY